MDTGTPAGTFGPTRTRTRKNRTGGRVGLKPVQVTRGKVAKLLTERYDAEETTHASQPLSKTRRRSPLVPHIRKGRRSHSSSEPAATEIPEPNPCSNIWRTVCEIQLWNFFTQNPLGVPTESTRVLAGPVWGLKEILSPTTAEFVPKGTPSDPSRKTKWADGWGPRSSVAASATALVLRKRILNQLDIYENVLHLFRQFGDRSALWSAVCTKFGASLLAASHAVAPHDLARSYTVSWSESELGFSVKFPVLVLAYGDNFKCIAINLPNKTTTQVMAHFGNHCQEVEKIDIAQGLPTPVGRGRPTWGHTDYAAIGRPLFLSARCENDDLLPSDLNLQLQNAGLGSYVPTNGIQDWCRPLGYYDNNAITLTEAGTFERLFNSPFNAKMASELKTPPPDTTIHRV
ncbi:hypothetical protein B0H11DRAFT_1914774 [Mycena galericulata]|nr:hypothetical protein B0H11DRAFT_1914774 [Mycena galericulata]